MKHTVILASLLAVMMFTVAAIAADDGSAITKTGQCETNWTKKTIVCTGSAAPNLKGGVVPAQIRLSTERAADLDAYRRILEAVKGVNIDSKDTIGAQMQSNPEVKARVEGLIKGMKRLDTRYYADGGVDVVVEVSLDGAVTEAVVKGSDKKIREADKGDFPAKYTGMVVDARGLKVVPALAPRILDQNGKEIYGSGGISSDVLKSSGMVAYLKSIDAAKKNAKVTDNPIMVKAVKLSDNGKSDLVLSAEDSAKLNSKEFSTQFLNNGRVVVVID